MIWNSKDQSESQINYINWMDLHILGPCVCTCGRHGLMMQTIAVMDLNKTGSSRFHFSAFSTKSGLLTVVVFNSNYPFQFKSVILLDHGPYMMGLSDKQCRLLKHGSYVQT